jgi:hypothetical protein
MRCAIYFLCLCSIFALGCESEIMSGPSESISLTLSGFSPSRQNETYALWLAFPKANIGSKENPQHGTSEYKLVSTFDVTGAGNLVGLDTINLGAKLSYSLELAQHALISIEKKDSVGASPNIPFLVGEITGTATKGNATLTLDHSEGVGYTFSTLSAQATLASPASSPGDYKGELYLMSANDSTSAQASINGLVPLPLKWKYGMWAVDSATKSIPPFNIFYGYFANVAQADSNPNDNRFNFPGGRYPASTSEPIYGLNTGQVTVLVTLEPDFRYSRPQVPFGALLLNAVVPKDQPAFTPFILHNKTLQLPQASLILNR